MTRKLFLNKDALAGLLFATLGLAAVVLSLDYKIGTGGRMGPGYVPLLFGGGTALSGFAIAARGVAAAFRTESLSINADHWNARPLFSVLTGILLFAILIKPAGLILSSLALLLSGAQANKGNRAMETLLLGGVLIIGVALVFVYGIGVRIDLVPRMPVLPWS